MGKKNLNNNSSSGIGRDGYARKRNRYGYPYADRQTKTQQRPTVNWINRNRRWIEVGIIASLFLTGSTGLGCVMLLLYIVDTM